MLPTASDLVAGELAVDLTNGRLYTENSGGTVLELGLNPNGNVNVTGTVTADGLTVDGDSTLDALELTASSSFPATGFSLNANGFLYGMAGSQGFILRSASNSKALLNISENNDISFYEDTGTTPKFFWDASAESLGIGTNSPTAPLTVNGTNAGIRFTDAGQDPTNYYGEIYKRLSRQCSIRCSKQKQWNRCNRP